MKRLAFIALSLLLVICMNVMLAQEKAKDEKIGSGLNFRQSIPSRRSIVNNKSNRRNV